MRICFLLSTGNLCNWQLEILKELQSVSELEIHSLIIVPQYSKTNIWWKIYTKLLRVNKGFSGEGENAYLDNFMTLFIDPLYNEVNVSSSKIHDFLKINQITHFLNLTNLQITGVDESTNTQFLQFNFGKSVPVGLTEILSREKTISFSLVKIHSDTEIEVLKSGRLKTTLFSLTKTANTVYKEIIHFPTDIFTNSLVAQEINKLPYTKVFHKSPSIFSILKLCVIHCVALIKFIWSRGFFVDHWNVGYVEKPIDAFLSPEIKNADVKWFKSDTQRFIADSFMLERNNEAFVFFEGLDYSEGVGYISVAKLENKELINEKVIIKEPFHLSYPFIVLDGNDVYCIPESNEADCINLYKATAFPYEWKKERTLIDGVKGIDSTFIKFNGLWWLFTTIKDDGPHSKLHIYYSEQLEGVWKSHKQNPVKIDICSSRGAGEPFIFEGNLYRPSQDYSEKIEGRIRINKINSLSPEHFSEEEVCIINPFFNTKFPDKIHTLSSNGKITVIDGCKEFFILRKPSVAFFKFKRIFKHILKR